MKLSVSNQEQLLEWAGPKCGTDDWPVESEAMAVVDDKGAIKAVMVINARYGDQCHLHFATDKSKEWATRRIIGDLLGYPFVYKKIARANVIVTRRNIAVQVMLIKMGWQFEGVLRNGAVDGTDGILFAMLADECRWTKRCIWSQKEEAYG